MLGKPRSRDALHDISTGDDPEAAALARKILDQNNVTVKTYHG